MRRHILIVVATAVAIIIAAAIFNHLVNKWDKTVVEASNRCADQSIRNGKTADQCVDEMMRYYHLNARLPKIKTVNSQEPGQSTKTTARTADDRIKNPAAATVNLPPGLQFMYIIPATDAEKMRLGRNGYGNIYVAHRPKSPRTIYFLQAGNTPGSWSEVLYIQER